MLRPLVKLKSRILLDGGKGLLSVMLSSAAVAGTQVANWTQRDYEDFRAGTPGDSGHNLYVSRDGRVQTIRRFDLNQDGHLDLVYNGTHDWQYHLPASLAVILPGREVKQRDVAVLGSSRVVVSDLNRDGHPDLVFNPDPQLDHLRYARSSLSIAWGGEDGWPAHRVTRQLPVELPDTLAVGDLNRDGWPDIISMNGSAWMRDQPSGRIVRVYWGGSQGYQLFRYSDWGVADALDLATGDLDGDGHEDLAVLSALGQVTVFWNASKTENAGDPARQEVNLLPSGIKVDTVGIQTMTMGDVNRDGRSELIVGTCSELVILLDLDGRKAGAPQRLKAYRASQITVGDADDDGWPDLVLTDSRLAQNATRLASEVPVEPVKILWGDRAGFSRNRATTLAVPHAVATAIGDFDGDGKTDIAVAVHQGETMMAAKSVIWFGTGNRSFRPGGTGVTTQGATHVATIHGRQGSADSAVFCNSVSGTLGEAISTRVYWGGPGGFDPERRWEFPMTSGYKALAADLRANGQVDLVVLHSGHAGLRFAERDPELGVHILWAEDREQPLDPTSMSWRDRQPSESPILARPMWPI